MKKKKIPKILIDMDGIIVDMLDSWLRQYAVFTGKQVSSQDVKTWDASSCVPHPEVLNSILDTPGFFRNLPAMENVQYYLSKLIENKGCEVIILTQPPRRSDYAVKDKRIWMQEHFPKFDLTNMVYAHKKYLIKGDVLFDDKPTHLEEWKKENPNGITATINYPYNNKAKSDWRWNRDVAWRMFYEAVKSKFL